MNIFVAGGGRVGFHLARLMSNERLDVTVIEEDADRVEHIDTTLDVRTIRGNGSSALVQQAAGVGGADLFVASMGNDEANLIAASMARGLGAKKVVARVDHPMYIESNFLYESALNVNYVLSPDAIAAMEISEFVTNPGVLSFERFGRGLVEMRQIRADASPTVCNRALKDVLPPGSGVLIGLVERAGHSFIPHGDSHIEPGDIVTLIGHKDRILEVQRKFHADEARPQRIAIMGGGIVGQRVAQAIQGKVQSVKIFERKLPRANELAALLDRTTVMGRDCSNRAVMEEEQFAHHDLFIAATNDDERNIMSSVLAKEVGVKTVAAIVHQPDFAPLVRRLGIDLAITPRASIANRILKLVHQNEFTSLAVLCEGLIEVIEKTVDVGAPIAGKRLKDLGDRFPRGALVATIIREDRVFVPGGEDVILAKDVVITIAHTNAIESVTKLLQKREV